MPFQSLAAVQALLAQLPAPDQAALAGAEARNGQLTKPPGALGRLEKLAIWMAGWQGTDKPRASAPQIVIFAGNHGVTAKGVSAFPAEVTVQMVANFAHGGAAINQLAKAFGAKLDVHALDLDRPTADFTESPAMTEAEVVAALQQGFDAVDPKADLFVAGEMGIGNTTAAAAIATALYGGVGWAGRGTGVDDEGLRRKEAAVAAGLERHKALLADPLQVLRCLGGREIAAMTGAILGARMARVPVIL
ncbi:MAG: nicotinate-nucleotide--dimethylbenzimidazole phosphoribosyltransferase, partial [Tabrizicola sp.]|nr:nicotinate-nucleotide--dimethylbenzimidazole phosphoribosyltransferase [Tabrizicola sp.]